MHQKTFDYLQPNPEQIERMQRLREAALTYCNVLLSELPDGPDKTYTIRSLRTVGMWANIAVTRQADGTPRT